jgi:hypothetical protein
MDSHALRKAVTFPPLPDVPAPWKEAQAAAVALLIDLAYALWNAAAVPGECLPGGPSLPKEQSAVQGVELQPSADMALLHLVRIMIKSDDCDPGAKLLAEACPHLKLVRANQGKPPVRVGRITATSAVEALLAAGKYVTDALRRNFGCGQLVNAVLNSFPHDPDLDPWDFGPLLVTWRTIPAAQEFAPLRRALAEKMHTNPSEFVRLLLTWDVLAALDQVRIEPLCRWFREQFQDFPADLLRQELELDFARAAQEYSPARKDSARTPTSPAGAATDLAAVKPRWDADRRSLHFGDRELKRYRRPAPNQEQILAAFEEEGWPRRIDDPLEPGKLKDTLEDLNETIKKETIRQHFLRFEGDGTGRGILWTISGSSPPDAR